MKQKLVSLALVSSALISCGGDADAEAGDRADAGSRRSGDVQLVHACELIEAARLDSVLGAPMGKPDSFTSGFDDSSPTKYSSCAYTGENHGILLKLTFPYTRRFSSSEEWAEKVREDYVSSVEAMNDPELIALMGNPPTHALDGVGDVAAWIDTRATTDMVILHAIGGRQRTYVELYAPDLDVARQVTEKLLTALP
jgi:hypothetical protein